MRHGSPDSNRNRALVVLSNFFLHFHPVKVRIRAMRFTRTFYLGGLTAGCFFILVVTGVLLMFVYHPAVPDAYDDVQDLRYVVSAGLFLRSLHLWASRLMVVLVATHLVLTFLRGAYRPPREFNWVIGIGLLGMTMLLAYTGHLLPWDQRGYWAVTIGTGMASATPLVGEELRLLFVGGTEIGGSTLLRFYVMHCTVLPILLTTGIGLHIWRIRKDGGIHLPPYEAPGDGESAGDEADASPDAGEEETAPPEADASPESDDRPSLPELSPDALPAHRLQLVLVQPDASLALDTSDEPVAMTFPHLLLRELVAFLGLSIVLVVLALLFDAPLGHVADPSTTPDPSKAPWFLVGWQELFHYYPPVAAAVLLPALLVIALAVIPYFQINVDRPPLWGHSPARTMLLVWVAVAALSCVLLLVAMHPVWPLIGPLWAVAITMTVGAIPGMPKRLQQWLGTRSLPFWLFLWFVISTATLTVIGIFFRGPGWSLTIPWSDGIFL